MLIPLSNNYSSLLSDKVESYKKIAEHRGNVVISATVTNSMFRVRSSHKSLTVYLEVPADWTTDDAATKAKWKYAERYAMNTGLETSPEVIRNQLAIFKKANALDVIDIHEL